MHGRTNAWIHFHINKFALKSINSQTETKSNIIFAIHCSRLPCVIISFLHILKNFYYLFFILFGVKTLRYVLEKSRMSEGIKLERFPAFQPEGDHTTARRER